MNSGPTDWVSFGSFRLSSTARMLERDGVRVALGSRALDVLIALVEHAGEIVSQRELIARAWRSLVVDPCNLRVQIACLRRMLDDGKEGARFIANVPGQGYCFVAPISATVPEVSNGVRCVDLGALRNPSEVMSAVASAVGTTANRDLLPTLRGFVGATEILLVLGNRDQVLGAAAALAGSFSSKDKGRHPPGSTADLEPRLAEDSS